MDDEELERIRAERLAQMKGDGGKAVIITGCAAGGPAAQADEDNLSPEIRELLTSEAHTRLNRIAVYQPEVVQRVEAIVARMARQGQLEGKVTEAMVMKFQEALTDQYSAKQETSINVIRGSHIRRGRYSDDSDSD